MLLKVSHPVDVSGEGGEGTTPVKLFQRNRGYPSAHESTLEEGVKVAPQSELLADEKDNILGKRESRHVGLEQFPRRRDALSGSVHCARGPRPPQECCTRLVPGQGIGKPACSWRGTSPFAVVCRAMRCRASSLGAQAT